MSIHKNTTTVTQLLQKGKFHFRWTREEKTYDQKYLRKDMSSIFKPLEKETPG